jgi:AbrB family looped-hinge helix DNA binding protein
MTIVTFRVSDRGQMALPAETRRRWNLAEGGSVDVADLGDALVIVPSNQGGLRGLLATTITESGGYEALVAKVINTEPELA